MRRLIVMRHATAVSGANLPTDHERPLTPRGADEAIAVARKLVERDWLPDRALVSDAARTCETWWCMTQALGEPPATLLPGFYGAGVEAMVAAVKRMDPAVKTVLVLGHNPGWSDAIGWLSGRQVRLAPAHAALLTLRAGSWTEGLGVGALDLQVVVGPIG